MKYHKIGVFLSSKDDLPEEYKQAAHDVGELIGSTGRTLVYGGARKGLMEILAKSVKQSGGRVFGMIPDIIAQRKQESDCVDVTFRCVDLSDRKAMMSRESDVIIALPGGIGTLDEVFTVMANTVIGIERKPIIFFNVNGCWNTAIALLKDLADQRLISDSITDIFSVAHNIDELKGML